MSLHENKNERKEGRMEEKALLKEFCHNKKGHDKVLVNSELQKSKLTLHNA